jgi:hypothetical protein
VDVVAPGSAQSYPFDEATLYDSPNALLRFIRRLLQPLLRMMFNPTPIAHALALQSRLNAEIAGRDAERDRRQAEWNALHYEILQRLALEVSRGSIESQNLLLRVESLAAKVDFNERRVRSMEGAQVRQRPQETPQQAPAVPSVPSEGASTSAPVAAAQSGEAPRRRRRRRRGRRAQGVPIPGASTNAPAQPSAVIEQDDADVDEGFEDEAATEPLGAFEKTDTSSELISVSAAATASEVISPPEPVGPSEPIAPSAPISSEPRSSSEADPGLGPTPAIQTAASHDAPLSPAEPDPQDGQVNE